MGIATTASTGCCNANNAPTAPMANSHTSRRAAYGVQTTESVARSPFVIDTRTDTSAASTKV